MRIILLLIENGKMTVTQMSKFVRVSRANLYHFVSELVRDGIVSKPQSVVKGNYVEKYDGLNAESLRNTSDRQHEMISSSSPESIRKILVSFFLSMSFQFRLYAERIESTDTQHLNRIVDNVRKDRMVLGYSIVSNLEYDYILTEFMKIVKVAEQKFGKTNRSLPKDGSRIIIAAIPSSTFT